jgi:hypothetical protein
MLGTYDNPSLHAKAAESHGLAKFVCHLLETHMDTFTSRMPENMARKGKYLFEAAKAANKLDTVFSAESRTFSRKQVQEALGTYLRFLRFYSKADGPITPKCHFMIHLIQRALFKGNPRKYSTYRDESFNGLIAKIARACHRRTWANVIHWKCQGLHKKHRDLATAKMFQKVADYIYRAENRNFVWESLLIRNLLVPIGWLPSHNISYRSSAPSLPRVAKASMPWHSITMFE